MQTIAHRSCARSLRRAACAALLVIALSSFTVPGTAVSAIVPRRGVVYRRHGGGRPNLRLQRPALRPDHLAADGARHRWAAGPRRQEPGSGISTAPAVRPDRSSGATACWSRPLEQRLALQPGGRGDIPRLGRTSFGRCIRRADISGRAALRRDQDLAAGSAAQV